MIQIPKNVMQIGEINPHTKIYMEDYVHTFLERRKTAEVYLAFGKKEEQNGILYYMIYGVEKKTDWDRGSLPYFKKYDRLGTVEGPADARVLKPVRGSGILLDGYFVFYEQNEDMQNYMIAVRETEELRGNEEKEAVMEAVRTRRGMRQQSRQDEAEAAGETKVPGVSPAGIRAEETGDVEEKSAGTVPAGRFRQALREQRAPLFEKIRMGRRREQNREQARRSGREQRQSRLPGRVSLKGNPQKERSGWTIPDLCRAGSLFLLLILVLLGLTSINRYPDMKEIAGLFANAAKSLWGDGGEQAVLAERDGQSALVVEEGSLQEEALVEEAVPDEGTGEEEELLVAEDGQVVWRIGGEEASSAETPSVSAADAKETVSGETIQEDPPQGQGGSEEVKVREGNSQQQESEPPSDEETSFLETEEGQEGAQEETAQQAISRPVTYVVKKGDSLAQIARKFYGNTSRLQEICTLNEIEDPDQIRPGQNILLP